MREVVRPIPWCWIRLQAGRGMRAGRGHWKYGECVHGKEGEATIVFKCTFPFQCTDDEFFVNGAGALLATDKVGSGTIKLTHLAHYDRFFLSDCVQCPEHVGNERTHSCSCYERSLRQEMWVDE